MWKSAAAICNRQRGQPDNLPQPHCSTAPWRPDCRLRPLVLATIFANKPEPVQPGAVNGLAQGLVQGSGLAGFTFGKSMQNERAAEQIPKAEHAGGGFCSSEHACRDCANHCRKLRMAGLRPTRQRIALASLLFDKGDRHVSAELLFEEASASDLQVSLATVYNTLHQFNRAGLLKAISIDASRTYFDTNTGNHQHFFLEDSEEVVDMPEDMIRIDNLPEPPEGMEIASVDIVVRVRAKRQDR